MDETCLMEKIGNRQGKNTEGKLNNGIGDGTRQKCRERRQEPEETKKLLTQFCSDSGWARLPALQGTWPSSL